MRKYFGSVGCFLVSFLFFAIVANAGIAIIVIDYDFQIKGDFLEITSPVAWKKPILLQATKHKITVVKKYGKQQYHIAIHKTGTATGNIFYRITYEKLTAIEEGIFVDWSKMEKP